MAAPLISAATKSRCFFCQQFHWRSRNLKWSLASIRKQTSPAAEHKIDKWVAVVGLEIHAQIKSVSKLFSGSAAHYGGNTNSQVSFFDAALPGTLPVLNKSCVEASVLTAMALKCKINKVSTFDRKHYFYADLPAGYQITQHQKPLAVDGEVVYVCRCSQTSKVERRLAHLVQIQLEQDSGKSLHDVHEGVSLIDLNRAGVGLMEIVTKPDFCRGDDAASFVKELRDILITMGTCDGKMAEGSLRVDANISIHKPGEPLGVRTEVKNLNSLKSIRQAIEHEIERQIEIVDSGGIIENETRSFDVAAGETVPMRDKEKILDYRFIPEPNLPPLVLHTQSSVPTSSSSSFVVLEEVAKELKELPDETRLLLEETYGLPLLHSAQLVREKLHRLFIALVTEHGCPPIATSAFLMNQYKIYMDQETESSMREETLADIIHLYSSGEISGSGVGVLMEEVIKGDNVNVREIAEIKDLRILGDEAVTRAMEEVLAKNNKVVKSYKKGKLNQLKILTAKVLKLLDGRANRERVNSMIAHRLKD